MAPAPEGASTGERRARGAYRRGALTRHLPCASSGQRSQRFGLCDRTWLWAAQRSQIMRIRQIATILLRFRLARTLAPAVNAHIRTFAPTPARNHAQEAFAGTAPARLKFPKSRRKPFRNRPWVHARQREDEAMRRERVRQGSTRLEALRGDRDEPVVRATVEFRVVGQVEGRFHWSCDHASTLRPVLTEHIL